jgi:hypothetical protein
MRNFKTYVNKTNELIKTKNLPYSPELFNELLAKVKSCPINQKEEEERWAFIITKDNNASDEKLGFMKNYLTTDRRLV